MKAFFPWLAIIAGVLCCRSSRAIDHFVSPTGVSVPPFVSWDTAATNIQDAIDAAAAGDVVWVTNGLYAAGGKVMAGDLTNRVALDKALAVQSVNGPLFTIIQGAWDPATTNGLLAVRCAWLTNGASLSGFTLQGGATRASASPFDTQQRGGGVYGTTNRAMLDHCVIRGNSAGYEGGGAYQVSLSACILTGNSVAGGSSQSGGGGGYFCDMTNCTVSGNFSGGLGGGAMGGILRNCALTRNGAIGNGGGYAVIGINNGTLINCTVALNTAGGNPVIPAPGGGVALANVINSVVYGNKTLDAGSPTTSNYYQGTFTNSCTIPLPTGTGNIAADPQLTSDGIHLAPGSPCIGAGTTAAIGTDIDGQPWGNPPSIGCDEWSAVPAISATPQTALSGLPPMLNLWGLAAGQPPFTYSWLKDGVLLNDGPDYSSSHTTNLTVNSFAPSSAGAYQLVASNAFGVATSAVALVVVHCADAAATSPAVPYSDWSSAANNIQDAVDAANTDEFVLVTNGVYATGGRVLVGDLTNRVAANKRITITSMSGANSTLLQGAYDPATTNGPLAVRCAWLGQGSSLCGFTLLGGATRNSGDVLALQSGGGVWCASTNESLVCCVLSNNMAASHGGGAYQGQLRRAFICGNKALLGGGGYGSIMTSSFVQSNSASQGGGVYGGTLTACTVTGNSAQQGQGGGEFASKAWNSIILRNDIPPSQFNQGFINNADTASAISLVSCFTTPPAPGVDTTIGPWYTADGFHLAAISPCRGRGSALYSSGTDIDGEAWLNPPSIGCDEYYAADFAGPILLGPVSAYNVYSHGPPLRGVVCNIITTPVTNTDRIAWSFGDGVVITNVFLFNITHTWTNAGDYNLTFTAYNADNPGGVSTNVLIHVALPDPPVITAPTYTGTNFMLTFSAQLGPHYVVEQTTNLVSPITWQTVATLYLAGTNLVVKDPNATNSLMRFYRVRVQ